MSGNSNQFVLEIYLKSDAGDPREQIRRSTCDLRPQTMVRVKVRNVPPVPFAVPFLNAADFAWYRSDLNWQFRTGNDQVLNAWETLVSQIRGAI